MSFIRDRSQIKLKEYQDKSLYRSLFIVNKKQGSYWQYNNKNLISFINNDYLGLSMHPEVVEAFQEGAKRYGVGSGASALLGGYHASHQALEEALADFLGQEKALIFPTGHMANLALFTSFMDANTDLFIDRLNHASSLDGARFSGAKFVRYQHRDTVNLEKKLSASQKENKWIASDSVFSMDGDLAPLPELIALAKKYHAEIILDDAHGIGVLGQHGRGLFEYFNADPKDISLHMGTLGKAFGCAGAFVAADAVLIEHLIQFSRSYIYTTALAPSVACAALKSLELIKQEFWRREYLQLLAKKFQRAMKELQLNCLPSQTPIQAICFGEASQALSVGEALLSKGILVGVIRPPTVPQGTSRLRINLSAYHSESDLDYLINCLNEVCHELLLQ